jgi:hypothetical protein
MWCGNKEGLNLRSSPKKYVEMMLKEDGKMGFLYVHWDALLLHGCVEWQ